jgi:transposase
VGGLLGGLDESAIPLGTGPPGVVLSCCVNNQGGRVGSRRDCTWILGLAGFRVEQVEGDDEATRRVRIRIEPREPCRYPCSGCGRRTARVRSARDRTWDDLPWAAHPVTLVYRQRRVDCRRCGIRTERIEFADAKARVTRRLRQQIGVDCQSMPTSHAAVRHGVSWGKARRAERAFLADWIASARRNARATCGPR